MTTFIITYDIDDGNKERSEAIVKALKDVGAKHLQLSVWLYLGNNTSKQVYEHFLPIINTNKDKLFVCQLTGTAQTNLGFKEGIDFLGAMHYHS